MSVRPIRLFGDPVLRTPAQPVTDFDLSLRNLVKDLTQTLDDADGSGLAAPQIGVDQRVFVFNVDGVHGHLINPGLDFPDEEEQEDLEGCLSFPGLYFDVKRRLNTVARGVNEFGDPLQVVGTQTLARCLQHETDHLDGILFVDRMDPRTRKNAMKIIRQAGWSGQPAPQVKVSPHRMSDRLR
jgi:peptide deformylase